MDRIIEGQRFGSLMAEHMVTMGRDRERYSFRCDCGRFVIREVEGVGDGSSCGCLYRGKDLFGMCFGEWEVIGIAENCKKKGRLWMCRCSCGEVVKVSGGNLKRGLSQRCKRCRIKRASDRKFNPHFRYKGKEVSFQGEIKSISEWARDERCKVGYDLLRCRLKKGWDIEKAIMTKSRQSK